MASPTFSNTEDKDNYQEEWRLPQSDVYVNLNNLVISQIGLDISTKRRHFILRLQTFIKENLIKRHNNFWKRTILVALLVIYFIYFGFAIHHNAAGALPLIIITSLVLVYAIYRALAFLYGYYLKTNIISPSYKWIQSNLSSVKWFLLPCLAIGVCVFIVFVVLEDVTQLQSVSGIVVFTFILWVTSKHLGQIRWRPVFWGFGLQFTFGFLVLRWGPGYTAIQFLSKQITTVISFSNNGAAAAFTDPFFLLHPFIFYVMPMLIYIGALLGLLYYYGITQCFAQKVGWLMRISTGTTAVESTSVAANIFLNMVDTMLMLRHYLDKLTDSEFHTFLVGSHSTVAGFAFGILVLFGVPSHHLLAASLMSAPAALAVSKLNYPETERSNFENENVCITEKTEETWAYQALLNGAKVAAKSSASLLLQIIAFLSIFTFINATIGWFGARVNIKLSAEIIFSYIFIPFAVLMGIDLYEAKKVATLLGLKIFTNEILAFMDLGQLIRNNEISNRSAAITTYAMCGFSSFGTVFMLVGVWATVHPARLRQVIAHIPRLIMNANLACFLTACIAGLMHTSQLDEELSAENAASKKSTFGQILRIAEAIIPSYKEILGNS